MFKSLVFVGVALLAFSAVDAKPKKAEEQTDLQQLATNTQNLINDVTTTLKKDLPDSKKVVEVLKTNADTLANNVQSAVATLNKNVKAHEGDLDKAIKQIQNKLTEASTTLKNVVGADNVAKAQDIKNNFDKGLKETFAEVEKLLKNAEPEVKKTAKTILDELTNVTTKVQKELKANLEKN